MLRQIPHTPHSRLDHSYDRVTATSPIFWRNFIRWDSFRQCDSPAGSVFNVIMVDCTRRLRFSECCTLGTAAAVNGLVVGVVSKNTVVTLTVEDRPDPPYKLVATITSVNTGECPRSRVHRTGF